MLQRLDGRSEINLTFEELLAGYLVQHVRRIDHIVHVHCIIIPLCHHDLLSIVLARVLVAPFRGVLLLFRLHLLVPVKVRNVAIVLCAKLR